MQIWVDADACPVVIKEIIFRAANRTRTQVILVANQAIYFPPSLYIRSLQVSKGFDKADNKILQDMQAGDLVITADIPLADAVIDKKGTALNPRGELYSKNNIKHHLSMRDFNEHLRGSGLAVGGPAKLSKKEVEIFANCLDKFLVSASINK